MYYLKWEISFHKTNFWSKSFCLPQVFGSTSRDQKLSLNFWTLTPKLTHAPIPSLHDAPKSQFKARKPLASPSYHQPPVRFKNCDAWVWGGKFKRLGSRWCGRWSMFIISMNSHIWLCFRCAGLQYSCTPCRPPGPAFTSEQTRSRLGAETAAATTVSWKAENWWSELCQSWNWWKY